MSDHHILDIHDETGADAARDEADLAKFGYKQELRRSLGVFSSFAVAFSYISPSTGIFTLFALGLTTIGGVFISRSASPSSRATIRWRAPSSNGRNISPGRPTRGLRAGSTSLQEFSPSQQFA
jgi:hypothetical protein